MGPIFESQLEPEAQIDPRLQQERELSINSELAPSINSELAPSLNSELAPSLNSELAPSINSELLLSLNSELAESINSERAQEQLHSELRRGTQARVPAQPRTELQATPDPIIERAIAATQRARVSM
ncbi:hypothetical protein VE02_10342, partial [Pseudogymnoascus sp. 03VT05]